MSVNFIKQHAAHTSLFLGYYVRHHFFLNDINFFPKPFFFFVDCFGGGALTSGNVGIDGADPCELCFEDAFDDEAMDADELLGGGWVAALVCLGGDEREIRLGFFGLMSKAAPPPPPPLVTLFELFFFENKLRLLLAAFSSFIFFDDTLVSVTSKPS
mmetsp:Transcript_28084/g.45643  ORF Transcript_28084/g.45643 Transcript_28084/m.45643 type:complete len:157 (+) Transcript_28084:1023-1493(+)